ILCLFCLKLIAIILISRWLFWYLPGSLVRVFRLSQRGLRQAAQTRQNLSESVESKVERLGQVFRRNVRLLRERGGCLDLVFLVDESSSVGASNFGSELRFVRKLLSDFPVAPEATRVALVTFSSKSHVVTRVDYVSAPKAHQHKCSLFSKEIPSITYRGGGTYTRGAFQRAAQILKQSRENATKAIFLITDGYSNGGDPRPVAAALRERGVEIFTLGIWQGNIRELHDMASHPKDQHCYLVHNFAEFEALARRALHEDLPTGSYIQEDLAHCSSLCEEGKDCCDIMASCKCGTHTGQYDCVCEKGYYGKGLQHECTACPSGTYKPEAVSGGVSTCLPCPDPHHTSRPGSTDVSDCVCTEGYRPHNNTCQAVVCPVLSPPENGFFIQNVCNNQFNSACGVRCLTGFDLQGDGIRLCQPDGTWSGVQPSCRVRSCPDLSPPRHGVLNCSERTAPYRLECLVRCEQGYRLQGRARLTCLANSQWSGPQPRCVEVRCPPIVTLKHISLSPPACGENEVRTGASCQLNCPRGYGLIGNSEVRCLPSGNWSDNLHKATCTDIEPPWIQCPGDVITETDEHQRSANISLSAPMLGDNSGDEVMVQVTPVLNPMQPFPVGTEFITYTATDRTGNKANCSFTVTVVDTEPPLIDRCRSPPAVKATEKKTAVYWEEPQFSDNSGAYLNISSTHSSGDVFSVGETLVYYTATDPSGNNRTCELIITVQGSTCEKPFVPVNGDFSCAKTEEGTNCSLICRQGYSLTQDAVHSYFCANNGIWEPPRSPDRPDCSREFSTYRFMNRIANNGFKPFEMLFKASRCDDLDMLKSFTGEFSTVLKDMVPKICGGDVTCKLEMTLPGQCLEYNYDYPNGFAIGPGGWGSNWGSQNGQDYAYFDTGFAPEHHMQQDGSSQHGYHMRTKRHRKITGPTREQKIQIHFNITASIPLPLSRNDSAEIVNQRRLLRALEQLTNRLKRTLSKQPFSTFHVSSEMIVADPKSLESKKKATLYCRPGSVLKGRVCVQCPVGTYFSLEYRECESCWRGSYQDEEGQMECKSCPDGFSTPYLHSRSLAECKAQCQPGSSSLTGLETCESCPLGEYQPDFGSQACLPCPHTTTTVNRGALDVNECGVPCSAGHFSRTGLVPCYPCPRDYYQPEEGRSYCLSCPFYGTTTITGAKAIQQCSSFGSSFLPKEESATAAPEVMFHECLLNPCQNQGTCEEVGVGYVCTCLPGFTGLMCEAEVNECSSSPCLNEGLCVDEVNHFTCSCTDGFTVELQEISLSFTTIGPRCELEINECASSPCQNGGVCKDLEGGYFCTCPQGFTGDNCEVDVDECYSTPCLNGGTCVDAINDFRCECVNGYRGRLCQEDIDDCDPNLCLNGATCVDGVATFTCRCPPGFNGTRCETEMPYSFHLEFEVSGIHGYVMMDGHMPSLTQITCTFWMRSSDTVNYGTPISYAVEGSDNAFLLIDYNGWVLYINGKERITDCPAVNDGLWHHIGVSWRSKDGDWRVYIDGIPSDGGKGLSVGTTIPGGGALVLGQDQDQRGDGFNPVESFVGTLSQLNIWNYVLTPQQIKSLASSCPRDLQKGNVFAWPDFLGGVTGRVKTNSKSVFCADCPLVDASVPELRSSTKAVSPGSKVQFSCSPGFYLVGEPVQQCLNRGQWSHAEPICERVECGPPPDLEHGQYHGEDFYAGSTVLYQCKPGFYLLGESKMLCTNNGKWIGNPPACLDVDECSLGSECDEHASCQNTDGSHICTCIPPYSGDGRNCTEPVKCKDPGVPEFGHREGSNFIMGSEVVFSCKEGYELIGSSHQSCTEEGIWKGDVPYCKVDCGKPPPLKDAVIKGDNFTLGSRIIYGQIRKNSYVYSSRVTYACNDGFRLTGKPDRICMANKQWSNNSPPVCVLLTCPTPPDIKNGRYHGSTFEVGSKVEFVCNEGYELIGDSVWTCLKFGNWDKSITPRCSPVQCPEPPLEENHLVLRGLDSDSGIVELSCEEGYVLHGARTLRCTPSQEWNDSFPVCKQVFCGPPPEVAFGDPSDALSYFGSVVTYSCMDGFTLRKESSVRCQADGNWSKPYPECIPVECPHPEDILNGIVDVQGLMYLSTAVYSCKAGYDLAGNSTVLCGQSGQWIGGVPICHPVKCAAPKEIPNGSVRYFKLQFSQSVTYSCHRGYRLQGPEMLTCLENGQWHQEAPTCVEIFCSPPKPIKNGFVEGRDHKFGVTIFYSCFPGFLLVGNNHLTCEEHGWSSAEPKCMPADCGLPPHIDFGDYSKVKEPPGEDDILTSQHLPVISSFLHGSLVQYHCHSGYEMKGDIMLMCQEDGTWNGTAPVCAPAQCETPPSPEYGSVMVTDSALGSLAEYSCEDGYELYGQSIRQCISGKQWRNDVPRCLPISCGNPGGIANGEVIGKFFHFKALIHYECHKGFVLEGVETRTCQVDGKWDSKAPSCRAISCGRPVVSKDVLVRGDDYTFGKRLLFSCNLGFILQGAPTSVCLANGSWSEAPPKCLPANCGQPPVIENGRVTGTDYGYNSMVTYACDIGYILTGNPTLICRADGLWDDPPPRCDIVTCDPPEDISHGYLNGSSFNFDDVVEYICFPGYEINGSPVLRCAAEGVWLGQVPECRPCVCSPPVLKYGAILGRDHTCGASIWFRCDEGYKILGPTEAICEKGGVWSPGVPICTRGRCSSPPPAVPNAVVQGSAAYPIDTVTYRCRPGYHLKGFPHLSCERLGRWGEPNLNCEPVSCGVPPLVPNADTAGVVLTYGSKAQYRCKEGFELATKTDSITCQSDGTWSKHSVRCRPSPCSLPANLTHVVITGKQLTPVGGTVIISCRPGYYLEGPGLSECSVSGNWSPPFSSKSCVPVICEKPLPIINGLVEGKSYNYGDIISYTCLPGFELQNLTCQANRKWSLPTPSCEFQSLSVFLYLTFFIIFSFFLFFTNVHIHKLSVPDGCERITDLLNGKVQEHNLSSGRALEFHCDKGYTLQGESIIMCVGNGSWSSPFPVCIRVSCGPPLYVANGVVRGAVFQFGDVVVYSCYAGYTMESSSRSVCLENGTWTPPPTCKAVCWVQCQNGGVCQRPNTCSCPEGWMGRVCEEPICILPCLNGGRCVAPYQCECPTGWTGTRCHNAVCSMPCLNGGRCIRPNRCHCSQGWGGYDCSRKRRSAYFHF
uniref:Sushi, von Willebrand factor type A, EGF and pentraxin domain-containing protein 1 n=1 Tax=Cyprinus carpio TaxID=7962 RepID=A0A8C1JVU7_CYPCA